MEWDILNKERISEKLTIEIFSGIDAAVSLSRTSWISVT